MIVDLNDGTSLQQQLDRKSLITFLPRLASGATSRCCCQSLLNHLYTILSVGRIEFVKLLAVLNTSTTTLWQRLEMRSTLRMYSSVNAHAISKETIGTMRLLANVAALPVGR